MTLKQLLSLDYHPKLILILNEATPLGASSSNILGMMFSLYLLNGYISNSYIYSLAIFSIIIFAVRIIISNKSTKYIQEDNKANPNHLIIFLITIIMTSIFYMIVLWSSILNGISDISIFLIATILLSLIAGSSSSMSSVFIAFLLYVGTNVISLVYALIYHGGEPFYIYTFLIIVFISVVIQSGYKHFNALKESIELKEEFENRVNLEVEKNRKKDEQILHQSRLAQMGEMISMIAHQWRQPLDAISSRINSIDIKINLNQYDFNDIRETNEFIRYMQDGHKHILEYIITLSETIDDFRTFFKPDKDKEFISLTIPIDRALSIVETKMTTQHINIIRDYQINNVVEIHSNEMMQVILSILKNSEDNFEEKSTKYREIKIVTKEDEKYYIIEIRDSGGGIPKDILDKIFNIYFTTKNIKNGTGLGLYMSKTIVEEHNNGILSVKNTDNGVSFEIKLKKEEAL